jgi:hypothetical protein
MKDQIFWITCHILLGGTDLPKFCYERTNKCVEESAIILLMHFCILPQHVSASHCHHHQGVVVSSEATQAIFIVDVYGLQPIQSGQLSRDVTRRVQWAQFLQWHVQIKFRNALLKVLMIPRHICWLFYNYYKDFFFCASGDITSCLLHICKCCTINTLKTLVFNLFVTIVTLWHQN